MAEQYCQPGVECSRFDAELMAYLEGESRPFVTAHVRECAFCAVLLADLEQIRFAARQFPMEEPALSVWANVRARLDQEEFFRPQSWGWNWLGALRALARPAPVGALACLAILGALLIAPPNPLEQAASRVSRPSVNEVKVETPIPPSPDSDLARMVENLEAAYRANVRSLPPETRAAYEKGLTSLDTSIRECKDSLRKEPYNTLAYDYLLSAYTQKAEVLASAMEFQGPE